MGKVINLSEWRSQSKEKAKAKLGPIPGFLVWLHCPTCKTTEYTELRIPGGRVHNKCGTLIQEAEVAIDVRAEYTVSHRNLKILEAWQKQNMESSNASQKEVNEIVGRAKHLLDQLKAGEQEFQHRLRLIAGKKIEPYPEDWDPQEHGVDMRIVHPFGIYFSTARQPDQYFPREQ